MHTVQSILAKGHKWLRKTVAIF